MKNFIFSGFLADLRVSIRDEAEIDMLVIPLIWGKQPFDLFLLHKRFQSSRQQLTVDCSINPVAS